MAKILVSLVSEQIIPNLRFIKEFRTGIDRFIFISTRAMEELKKTELLIKSSGISLQKTLTVVVLPFNFKIIEETLLELELNYDDEYLVNITGGTKPMSIIVLSFFSSLKNAKIFYMPIDRPFYRQVLPRIKYSEIKFAKNLTLKEYLKGIGLDLIKNESTVTKNISEANQILNNIINGNNLKKILSAHEMDDPIDKSYYSGRWFEELIFYKIKKHFKLNINQIAYNVKLKNNKTANEYDIMFVYKNTIHIIECKAYFSTTKLREKIEKDLYKLGALNEDFGLNVNSVYITTANIKGDNILKNKSLNERAKSLNIKLFQLSDLKNDLFLTKM